MDKIKPFSRQGNFTVFDNYILDIIMPDLSPNSWKCLCLIIRKTVGWHKVSDEISYSQIRQGTGIKSSHTVVEAIKELEQKSYIVAKRFDNQWSTNSYRLNVELEISIPSAENALGASAENALGASAENAHTKEKKKKENKGDYIDSIRSFHPGNETKAEPSDWEKHFGYRDEFLKAYNELTGEVVTVPAIKEKIALLGAEENARPEIWRKAIEVTITNWSGHSNIPPLTRIIEVYRLGGNYDKWIDRKYGDENRGNGKAAISYK